MEKMIIINNMKIISKLPIVVFLGLMVASVYLNYQGLERVDWNLKYPFMTEKEVEDFRRKKEVKKIELFKEKHNEIRNKSIEYNKEMKARHEAKEAEEAQKGVEDPYKNLTPEQMKKVERMKRRREERLKQKEQQNKEPQQD
jgi:pyruvate/2-oxoacid:ferredoxin oxidoreductase alpha subunit